MKVTQIEKKNSFGSFHVCCKCNNKIEEFPSQSISNAVEVKIIPNAAFSDFVTASTRFGQKMKDKLPALFF